MYWQVVGLTHPEVEDITGLALWSVPLALVAAGLMLVAGGVLGAVAWTRRQGKRHLWQRG
jgi:hypothetical protein